MGNTTSRNTGAQGLGLTVQILAIPGQAHSSFQIWKVTNSCFSGFFEFQQSKSFSKEASYMDVA